MSFRLKTILGVALIESVLLLILVLGNLNFLHRSFDEELHKRAESSIDLFIASSKDAVIATDLATLDDALRELLRTPGVAYARVYGTSGLLSQMGDPVALNRPFVADEKLEDATDGIFDHSRQILSGDYSFGRVELGLRIDEITSLMADARQHNVSVALSEILLVALFSTLLGGYLTRQLRSLTKASEEIAAGKEGVLVPVKGKDELAEAARAFNQMSHQLQETLGELKLAHTFYEASSEGIVITDADNRIIAVNPAFSWITGYSEEEVLGKDPSFLSSGRQGDAFFHEMWSTLQRLGRWQGEIWNRRKSGELYPEWLSIVAIKDKEGNTEQYMAVFSDITRRKRDEEKIWQQANFDMLTGLPNRTLFMDRLDQSMHLAHREGKLAALLFIDLDRFKWVNDTLGHAAGDTLLQMVAERLLNCVRETDTVARLGGDEFTVILSDIDHQHDVDSVAEQILQRLSTIFTIQEQDVMIGASIGITIYPRDATEVGELMRYADTAMYRSKQAGRNTYRYYTQEMNEESERRMRLEHDVRLALGRNELAIHYQPIVDTTGRLVGAEALLRWHHAELGVIPPDDFIPLAEETGVIVDIEKWVISEACERMAGWNEQCEHPLFISVNISAAHCNNGQCKMLVDDSVISGKLKPGQLKLEITERMMMENTDRVVSMFEQLRKRGVQLAVDDFGTGYSSLSYLKRFPVDVLKIDRAFIRELPGDVEDVALVEAMIAMAHSLGMKLVAEGVEDAEQYAFLVERGVEMMQGFYFSRPMPEAEFSEYLDREQVAC